MSKRIIVSLIAAIALAVGALPAGAGGVQPTGVRLSLLSGGPDRAILANTPFNVKHGFFLDAESTPNDIQTSQIRLTVDGNSQNGYVIQEFSTTKPPTLISKQYLFNFKNGLPPGTYAFQIQFVFRGEVILTVDRTIYSLASCENGTTNGLLCAPPPTPSP
jgi:hypothetical protein